MGKLLEKIKGNTYYIKGHVNTGLYIYDDDCCVIIDTGSSEDWGRKIHKALKTEGLNAKMIINTHSHADHYGGNNILVKRTGAEVAATDIEAAIISNPYLEPFYLYSAHPPKSLLHKSLMGKKSPVDKIIEPGDFYIGSAKLKIVDLKGHSPGQIGVATPDGVIMTADAYFSSDIIKKYSLPYFNNIGDTLTTLIDLKATKYSFYLPCHGELTDDVKPDIDANLKILNETMGIIRWALIKPMTREELGAIVSSEYNLKTDPIQYYLSQSSLAAYLSYMTDEGILQSRIEKYKMVWEII